MDVNLNADEEALIKKLATLDMTTVDASRCYYDELISKWYHTYASYWLTHTIPSAFEQYVFILHTISGLDRYYDLNFYLRP